MPDELHFLHFVFFLLRNEGFDDQSITPRFPRPRTKKATRDVCL
jgi:hypothetical protein